MKTKNILKTYSVFRKNMGASIDEKVLKKFWDIQSTDYLEVTRIRNSILDSKINIAKNSVKYLLIFDWVKFIAVSGSVASGFAKEEDDIDIFLIVKNDRAWMYRIIMMLKNLFNKKIRTGAKNVKDKLCINLIVEERDLFFEPDIFNFNEIISMIPVYNEDFFVNILRNNMWLFDNYLISRNLLESKCEKNETCRYVFFGIFNFIFLLPQLLFMLLSGHKPDFVRIIRNFKRGRIEFFPEDFKAGKLENLNG